MARILYGLCGEGLGHASRSRILIHYLLSQNHEIKIIAGGKAYRYLSKEFRDVEKIESARFFYKEDRVRLLYSILWMMYRTVAFTPKSFQKVRRIILEFQPDVVLTDADPISNYAGSFSGIKRISIDNPQALVFRKYNVRFSEFWSWFSLIIGLKISMFNADKYLIYDFFDKQIDDDRVVFVKPLIQEGILCQKPVYGSHVFVYQTSSTTEYISKVLKKFNEDFVVYGFDKDFSDGNVVFKRFNENEFYHDIASAKAVVTNGGFTVLSEALYLKKPIFALPLKQQFEQILNGRFIERLGAGVSSMDLNESEFRDFLLNLEVYQKNLQKYDPGVQEDTLKGIEHEMLKIIDA